MSVSVLDVPLFQCVYFSQVQPILLLCVDALSLHHYVWLSLNKLESNLNT